MINFFVELLNILFIHGARNVRAVLFRGAESILEANKATRFSYLGLLMTYD